MHFTFEDQEIRRICEQEQIGRLRLGDDVFERLRTRLTDLLAAQSLEDLPMQAVSISDTEFGLDLGLGAQLIFRENRVLTSRNKSADGAHQSIKSIKLVRVEK